MVDIAPKLNNISNMPTPGSGGFLNPDIVVEEFGIEESIRIADFGSGSGYFTILAAKKVGDTGKVVAIDVLSDVLEHLKAKAEEKGLSNIELVRANLEIPGSSGLEDNSQDMVLIVNVLFQSSKKENIISEAKRILKPGGKLVFMDWEKGVNGFGPPDEERTSKEEMSKLISGIGFEVEREINVGSFHYGFVFHKK
ncbi:MAG: hypothetical protein COV29_04225 [Candidatus Yanofskybacteria bacterium CG10_big_fil_rev_8_21_14_0_10_36_16]|uniref:Methyltransferase domain-containing protein n=1 Tax=Candidatus Yanofskybacteria bacterium CG10_big_fil_rev_8_21_14_0_10_36_16 TaxID=1975096 RepID=A0A2J0Q6P8_9BACT|nr:MAG: hypothetical protein COV29_04225 [Candidatus Yanofskybacteria bacterium CG10_big_fil_rev_8_21_14_0_10_36_16]